MKPKSATELANEITDAFMSQLSEAFREASKNKQPIEMKVNGSTPSGVVPLKLTSSADLEKNKGPVREFFFKSYLGVLTQLGALGYTVVKAS